jgi:hypothetical protein
VQDLRSARHEAFAQRLTSLRKRFDRIGWAERSLFLRGLLLMAEVPDTTEAVVEAMITSLEDVAKAQAWDEYQQRVEDAITGLAQMPQPELVAIFTGVLREMDNVLAGHRQSLGLLIEVTE